jgi:tetratricopeptide (TPR) repeat protein
MKRLERFLPALVPLLVIGVALAILAPRAVAQAQSREQVREYIDRTEELILWARDLVAETESGPARRILQSAADMHQRSRRSYEDNRPLQALEISRRARTATFHAVRVAREALGLQERIQIGADRFGDEHRQLTERAREVRHQQAADILDQARRKADRARELYRQGDFKLAWKMLEQAGDLNRRAARLLADAGGPERLDAELERTAELLARTRDRLGPDADARALDLLEQAQGALERARRAREEGRPGQALQLAGLARQLVHRVEGTVGSGPREEDVRRQIERFDDRFDRVAERVRDVGDERARDLLQRARGNRDRAAEDLAAGDTDQALRRIRAAHDLLGQAEDVMPR